ncbi:alpha/beta hydrolase [Mycobacterium sp. ACS4331]|uniref:alpha/beta hydrolase n=1 Tax=Mycobacterium sp. ACS4331 TaxID=1834121 RepID=UPI0007FCF9D1|nr:alpha/beta hydrolase [Mycobacterium sp. ACS4331]OBF26650.1 lipase [Mycobacterium sp. ACS4331]
MASIDPILQQVLDVAPFRLTPADGPDVARKLFADLPRPALYPDVRSEDRRVAGAAGDIPIRIYWPAQHESSAPVVLFFHGGGFAVGDLDTYDNVARQHAVDAEAIVVAVEYRLAPEYPYPAAVQDVWAVTRWVGEHAEEFGGDPSRLAVAGDSAGGNLAAVVAQMARDEGGPALVFQLLWYPAITSDVTLPSFAENADAPILDLAAVEGFTAWYAGHVDLTDPAALPASLAPERAASLAGLPPAYVAVAGHDPLRDGGRWYAELLEAAGVPVTYDNADTLVHGYLAFAGLVPATTEAKDRGMAALRRALHD